MPRQSRDLYEILGVDRDATTAMIRKAYRRQALLNHPDKNVGDPDAEQRFLEVATAFDVLASERKRVLYDRGDGLDDEILRGFDFGRASDLFHAHFGRELMEQWRPGLTVSGTLILDGTWLSITIHPDGSTEEHERTATGLASVVSYTSMTVTNVGGGRIHSMNLATRVGQCLARCVPYAIARVPILGPAATTFVSWVPTMLVGLTLFRLFSRRSRVPGELPDCLADALRQAVPPPAL